MIDTNPNSLPSMESLPMVDPQAMAEMMKNQPEIQEDVVENELIPAQAAPEEVSPGLQALQQEVQSDQSVQPFKKVTPQESFAKLRKERDDYAKRLAAYETQQQQRYEEPKLPQLKPRLQVNDDDLMEGKHLKLVDDEIQQLRQELQQQKHYNTTQIAQAQIRSKFPDFDKVVNEDNIEQLKYSYPELAATLNASSDLYSTAVSAYTMIKNLGIAPERNDYMADKAQAQKNAAKPKPLASVSPQQGDSPLSKANAFANGLTPELKAQMIKEMNDARKGI
jgi:hypothetical protein